MYSQRVKAPNIEYQLFFPLFHIFLYRYEKKYLSLRIQKNICNMCFMSKRKTYKRAWQFKPSLLIIMIVSPFFRINKTYIFLYRNIFTYTICIVYSNKNILHFWMHRYSNDNTLRIQIVFIPLGKIENIYIVGKENMFFFFF